jgi:hypothetical protein
VVRVLLGDDDVAVRDGDRVDVVVRPPLAGGVPVPRGEERAPVLAPIPEDLRDVAGD